MELKGLVILEMSVIIYASFHPSFIHQAILKDFTSQTFPSNYNESFPFCLLCYTKENHAHFE